MEKRKEKEKKPTRQPTRTPPSSAQRCSPVLPHRLFKRAPHPPKSYPHPIFPLNTSAVGIGHRDLLHRTLSLAPARRPASPAPPASTCSCSAPISCSRGTEGQAPRPPCALFPSRRPSCRAGQHGAPWTIAARPVPPPCRACRRDKQSAVQCSACPQCLLPAAHAEGTGDQPCSVCSLEKDALCSKTLRHFVLFQLILVSCPFYR